MPVSHRIFLRWSNFASCSHSGSAPRLREMQATIWHQMLQIWADEVFTIGTVGGVLQPVVVNDKLRNIPEKGHL